MPVGVKRSMHIDLRKAIAPAILLEYLAMSEAQREVVGHDSGAVLVIAGPVRGKPSV